MSNNENSGNNGGSEYDGDIEAGANIDILLVIRTLTGFMSCEEALEFIRKIRIAIMIDSEAENELRALGFSITNATRIVKQINDYVAYHNSKGADPDIWNTHNENVISTRPPGNEGGGRRSRKSKKQRRRTRRRN